MRMAFRLKRRPVVSKITRALTIIGLALALGWMCAPRQFEAVLRATASYPGAVKAFTTKNLGDVVQAAHMNDVQDEVTAIEQALLTTGFAHDLFPSTDGTRSNGTSTLQWLDVFASRKVRAGILNYRDATTLTIASGVVTATRSYHALDTEGAAAADDLDTITAGTGIEAGALLTLRAANVAHVVTLKDTTGNLLLNGDYALSATDRTITLLYDGTNWREMARSVGSGTSVQTGYAATLANVSNTGTETTILSFDVPANDWADGDVIYVWIATLNKNNKGSTGTVTAKVNAGAGAQVTLSGAGFAANAWQNSATEFKTFGYAFAVQRVGSDVWVIGPGLMITPLSGGLTFGPWSNATAQAADGTSTPTNFTSTVTVSLKVTLSAADSTFYMKPQAARIWRQKSVAS
jgi:hypothetical protein